MTKKKSSIIVYMVLVSAVLLAKVLGLVRGIVFSAVYGTGIEANAFTAVSNLPLTLFDVTFGTAITSAFVPVFNEKLSKEGSDSANKFACNFFNIIITFSVIIVALGILFPKIAVMIVASGFNGKAETMQIAVSLIKYIIPVISFACCTFIFIGILQSYGEFIAPALVSLLSNVAMIVYLLFFNDSMGIEGLGLAFSIGWFLQFVFLIPFLIKKKFKYTFCFDVKSPDIRKVALLTLPLFVAALAQPINQLISSNFSSLVSENGVATVNYAYTAYLIVAGVFSYALTNMFFPEMSRRFAVNDVEGATGICKDMLSSITAIIMPIMSFFIACSHPIINILYERGEFTPQDTINVSALLAVYSVGMIFLSWQDIFNKYFYSMQKSYIPMITAFIGIGVNILLSFTLTKYIGLLGLSVATVSAGIVMTVILSVFAVKATKSIFVKPFIFELSKIVLSGFVSFAVSKLLLSFFDFNVSLMLKIIYVVVIFVASLVIYIFWLLLFRSSNLAKIKNLIKKGGKTDNV